MAWTTPRTWVTGELVTAALMNTHLKDNLNAIVPVGPDGWTSYTPTLTQSATVTKTVTYAKYMKVGRLVTVNLQLACTSSGTAANAVVVGLPLAAAATASGVWGTGVVFDASANLNYGGIAAPQSTTTFALLPTSADSNNYLGAAVFTAALASGDIVLASLHYEAAS